MIVLEDDVGVDEREEVEVVVVLIAVLAEKRQCAAVAVEKWVFMCW